MSTHAFALANYHLLCHKPVSADIQHVKNNSTPFWIAVLCGYKEAVTLLLKTEDFKLYSPLELKILLKYAMKSGHIELINHLIQEIPELENTLGVLNCFRSHNTLGKCGVIHMDLLREFNSYNHCPDYMELREQQDSALHQEIRAKIQKSYTQITEVLINKIKIKIQEKQANSTTTLNSQDKYIKTLETLMEHLKNNSNIPPLETITHWETSTFSDNQSRDNRFLAQKMIQEPGLKLFIENLKDSVRVIPEPKMQPEKYRREEKKENPIEQEQLHYFSTRLY